MWKSATPYVMFFIVLLVTVAVLPLCDKHWIPCSEMSLVALFFTGEFVNINNDSRKGGGGLLKYVFLYRKAQCPKVQTLTHLIYPFHAPSIENGSLLIPTEG